ncbi:MAG: S9 family peptidase [Microscillaceae bacterium]|nr:S9 family peptidase [Microscillaceae bacterium]
MSSKNYYQIILLVLFATLNHWQIAAQQIRWAKEDNIFYTLDGGQILKNQLPALTNSTFITREMLTPQGESRPLKVENFSLSDDNQQVLIYTNSQKVWRYKTRGDYWVLNLTTKQLRPIGKGLPTASLMFAKFSADGKKVAYVSKHNVYVEDLATQEIKKLTTDNGTRKLINGTFDWVYEEEFSLRDGFRWSADNQHIAYWQIDANAIRDYYMLNTTDSVYSQVIPVEYPKAGDPPSPAKIGVVNINTGNTIWLQVPGVPDQNYLARMEWTPDGKEVIVQQLNRKQNESKIYLGNPQTGAVNLVFAEKDEAWVSHINEWKGSNVNGWDWLAGGKEFIWTSEQDGWRHLWRISRDGKTTKLITKGDYDVMETLLIDEKAGFVYFYASPQNATQKYLYKTKLDGSGKLEKISPANQEGTHSYNISPNGKYARHSFSNYYTFPLTEWLDLTKHKALRETEDINKKINLDLKTKSNISYFRIKTEDGVDLDGWMMKPTNFDENKKYPVVFYVYGEPAATTVNDAYGNANGFLYGGDMAGDGYIHISLDNRGTPAPRGRAWRKAIYGKIGQINIRDQAMGAKKILEWKFIDAERVAVWGWSGGGSSTLNLLFQYPNIYKTGISIAPVTASYLYDNIYTERFMGLPQENQEGYKNGAALTHAKNLQGNLLLIHGTGDDNVHFQNSEMLVNELIKHGKQFNFMPYPNRTHSISEGEGTSEHLVGLCTKYLRQHCAPGAK